MHRFRLLLSGMRCRFLGCGYVLKPGRADRLDPYCAGGVRIFHAFPAQAVVYGRNHPCIFFSSSLADVALWLGPYMSISGKTSLCTRTKTVWKCRQITTTTTTHNPARRPANPPARLAFRQEKQQTRQTKGAGAQTKTTTKEICQRTQWFDHCIILKNMRK